MPVASARTHIGRDGVSNAEIKEALRSRCPVMRSSYTQRTLSQRLQSDSERVRLDKLRASPGYSLVLLSAHRRL